MTLAYFQRDLEIINRLGATHVLVSSTWAPDKYQSQNLISTLCLFSSARVHDLFLNRLKDYDMKIIVEFRLPVRHSVIAIVRTGFLRAGGRLW